MENIGSYEVQDTQKALLLIELEGLALYERYQILLFLRQRRYSDEHGGLEDWISHSQADFEDPLGSS